MAVSAVLAVAAMTQPSSLLAVADQKPQEVHPSLSSSPRQYPTDLTSPILEEGDESESEPLNEPLTPTSGRQSEDFHQLQAHDVPSDAHHQAGHPADTFASLQPAVTTPITKPPLILNTVATPPLTSPGFAHPPATPIGEQDPAAPPLTRRSTRGSSSSFKRTMSNIFRRSNSQSDKAAFGITESGANGASDTSVQCVAQRKEPSRRWSMNRSSTTTRSNTPPSPGSPPLEMRLKPVPALGNANNGTPGSMVPSPDDFFNSQKKKSRASTGFSLRSKAIHFVGGGHHEAQQSQRPGRLRASSFDFSNETKEEEPVSMVPVTPIEPDRQLWGMPAAEGTGLKARRMSLSVPDDFTVDVQELLADYEYQHKLFGRHGKHIGKGATSKVALMNRKGCPSEIYAVKEFRGKSTSESKEDYQKKIKSEFTLSKSLHHPNIVETIALCTDHGRWNHVMEYCAEGDLFGLVQRGFLKSPDREKDRLCLFKQLVQGLNYLHTNGIAHRDIKLENLLITSDSKLKIADFGVSEVFSGTHPGLREAGGECGYNMGDVRLCNPGICGSEPYIAPEVLAKGSTYDPRGLDVWSSAIVMIYLIFGGALWTRADLPDGGPNYLGLLKGWAKWNAKQAAAAEAALTASTTASPSVSSTSTMLASSRTNSGDEAPKITEMDYPKVSSFDLCVSPPALRRLLLQMLNPDPARRISMDDVLNNRWVKNIECCQLESYDDPARMIDASKKNGLNGGRGPRKIFCHTHLPPKELNTHSIGKMPGQAGY